MKLTKLFFGVLALTGLAACSNDSETALPEQNGDLTIKLHVADAKMTRGIIEGSEDVAPKIVNATAYVMLPGVENAKYKVVLTKENDFTGKLKDISLKGNEKVVVAINKTDRINADGLKISEIQPDATENGKGKGNVFYYSAATAITKDANGKDYSVEVNDIKPVAARVEVSGKLKFNENFVKSAVVGGVTPNKYTAVYSFPGLFEAKKDAMGGLWKELEADDYKSIEDRDLVVANHLFAGDQQRVLFRVDAVNYDLVVKESSTEYKKVLIGEKTFFVYSGTTLGEEYIREKGKFYKLGQNTESRAYEKGAELTDENAIKTTSRLGYFSLVKFEDSKLTANHGNYEAGNIYKISFGEIDWNGDGVADDKDGYDPTVDPGTEDPTTGSSAGLTVKATVAEWTIKNVVPGIE